VTALVGQVNGVFEAVTKPPQVCRSWASSSTPPDAADDDRECGQRAITGLRARLRAAARRHDAYAQSENSDRATLMARPSLLRCGRDAPAARSVDAMLTMRTMPRAAGARITRWG
jgi:hypothetical protein